MNLRRDRLKTCAIMPHKTLKDEEGSSYDTYSESEKVRFKAEAWAAGGQLQQMMYGEKLPQVRNLRISGGYKEVSEGTKTSYHVTDGTSEFDITVNDGICLNDLDAASPEYRVTAIYPYRFLQVEVQRI